MVNTTDCDICRERRGVNNHYLLGKFDGVEYIGAYILCDGCKKTVSDETTTKTTDDDILNKFDNLPDWVTTSEEAIVHLQTRVENLEESNQQHERRAQQAQHQAQSRSRAKMEAMQDGKIYNYEGFRPKDGASAAGIAAFSITAFLASALGTALTILFPTVSIVPIAMGGISISIAAGSYAYYYVSK